MMEDKLFNFGIIGAAGYVAPKHMKAIFITGNQLVAALDPNDSVGIIDSYFPDAYFFKEVERFDRHLNRLRNTKQRISFVSICSPNHLHDSHIRMSLNSGCDVICEKPLVLNPWNVDSLKDTERLSGKKINSILQLRVHPTILHLKRKFKEQKKSRKHEIDITYISSRGRWYHQSWKGKVEQSGGIATNIGIHFFDMLHFLFGNSIENNVHMLKDSKAAGYLEFGNAKVRWLLSIDVGDIPRPTREQGKTIFRSINVDGEELEFSDQFGDLHTLSYEKILSGNGFSLDDTRSAIETVSEIRNAPISKNGDKHPFLKGLV